MLPTAVGAALAIELFGGVVWCLVVVMLPTGNATLAIVDAAYSGRCCACNRRCGYNSMLPTAVGAALAIGGVVITHCWCFVVDDVWYGVVLRCVAMLPTGNAALAIANPLL
jgi:hypothetical protein